MPSDWEGAFLSKKKKKKKKKKKTWQEGGEEEDVARRRGTGREKLSGREEARTLRRASG
jgi:hypothetical protein